MNLLIQILTFLFVFIVYKLTIIMTMISTLFPNVLDLISLMEKYHPRTSLRLQLARLVCPLD